MLKARHHESFERSGNDLLTTVHITLSEALLGFSRILVTHLDGRGLRVSSPPGKIIKPGDNIVIRDEGMPVYKNPDHKGNLYVMLQVDMPDETWLGSVDRTVTSILPSSFYIQKSHRTFSFFSSFRTIFVPCCVYDRL